MAIIAVWGPPRSGKTTLAIDMAFALSAQGASVCLISPEVYSELSARLEIRIDRAHSLTAAYKPTDSVKPLLQKVDGLFFVLSVSHDTDAFEDDIPEDTAKSLLEQTATLFDVVLVDCPSHTDSVLAAWSLSMAGRVLLTTGASAAAVMWHRAFSRATEAVSARVLNVCIEVSEDYDYRSLHGLLGIAQSARLPYVRNADIKRTLYGSGGKPGKKYTKDMDKLCKLLRGGEA